jgi:coenzyme F420-reducing hydrogenase alpha subunit
MTFQTLISVLALVVALFALVGCIVVQKMHSADHAQSCSRISEMEKPQRSTASLLAASAELRESCERAETLLDRVNKRDAVRASRERRSDGTFSATSTTSPAEIKAELRRRVGIVPGRPAPHG